MTEIEILKICEDMCTDKQRQSIKDHIDTDFTYVSSRGFRHRVNVYRQRGNTAIALRLLRNDIPTLTDLDLPPILAEFSMRPRGLVLVTGPTGSGKSTTLAAMIDHVNIHKSAHIITIEDPIEYMHAHKRCMVNQREIGFDTQGYAPALRAALREDPDVILVGEMRDLDTISTAITAAETGHLVFSTLHTIGAVPTIERIIDVFPTSQQPQIRIQLATLLEAVVSQQLQPTADKKGRVAAFEIMFPNSAIRNLIRESKAHQIPSIIQTSRADGMITMDDALFDLYRARKITKEEAISFAQDKTSLLRKLF